MLLTPEDGETAARCQGIVFTGGYDIHPSLYPRRAADRDLTDEEIIQRYKLEGDDPRCFGFLARKRSQRNPGAWHLPGFQVSTSWRAAA